MRRGLQSWRGLIIFGFRMIGRIIGNIAPVLVVLLLSGGGVAAQAILAPPFGLQWGDTPDKILDWAREKNLEVRADFERVKKAMVAKHGQFTPDAKRDKRVDGYIRHAVSYHVEPVSGLLLLIVKTEVEDTLRKKRSARFSLLYRNENVIPKKK